MRILRKKGKFAQKRERKGLWRGVVTCIAAVVVFCTTYALILPAITMETQGFTCGLTEHSHSQDCYQLKCGKQEYFSHTHGKECYQDSVLVCKLVERTVHHHSDDCYSKPEYACGKKESKGHSHSEGCYTTERNLICSQSECAPHTHSEGCYREEVIPCKLEERKGHSHSEDCYTDGELTCGKEESEGHTHSEACTKTKQVLTCVLAETQGHSHSDGCYEAHQVLTCGKEESKGHTHSDKCYPSDFQGKLICGQEDIPEHRHSQSCYARICELEEHTHSERCVKSHEEFLQNQEELLKKENQTDSGDNSSEEERKITEDSQEQSPKEEEQIPENSEKQSSEDEEQTPVSSEEQSSKDEEQTTENSEEQPSKDEEQTTVNSEEQSSKDEEQAPVSSEEQSSKDEEQTPENSEEQSSKDEDQTPENYEEQSSKDEEQTPENSEEQSSEDEEQTPENSEKQSSEDEEQTPENSEEQSSKDEEQTPVSSEEQSSEDEEQTPENSEEQSSKDEEQTPENSEEQSSKDEEQTPENSEKQSSEDEEQTPENSEKQPSEDEEQEPENSEEELSEAKEQTTENSEEEPSEDDDLNDTDSAIREEEPEIEVDWADPESAIEAGFYPVCENDEEEHVHTQECYVPIEELDGFDQGASYNFGNNEDDDNEEGSAPMPLTDNTIPVGENGLSATGTVYNPSTDTFSAFVAIDFTFPEPVTEGEKAVVPGTVYTYTYPSGIIIPDGLLNTNEILKDKAGNTAGSYTFVKNDDGTYSVRATFSPDYVNDDSKVGPNQPVGGYIKYSYEFSGSQLTDSGFKFGDTEYTLPVSPPIEYPNTTTETYDIDVSKEGTWAQEGDKLVYTVYVRTTKGTPDSITFADTMTIPEGLTIGDPTVQIEKGQSTYYKNWQGLWSETSVGDWTVVTSNSPSYSDGSLSMSLGKLYANETTDGNGTPCIYADTYRITYSYPITEQTAASVSPKNKVTVTAEDSAKGQTVTDSSEATVPVSKDFSYTIDKNGRADSDKPGYIKWTVTVNKNHQSLVGAALTDQMLGLVEDNTEYFSIEPSTGAQVNLDTNGKITGITFTGDENGVNKNQYTITYYTPVEESWDGTTVNNTAVLDPDPDKEDDEKEAPASVEVKGVQLGKNGTHNVKSGKLDWFITINAGNLDINGATLTDSMISRLKADAITIEPATGYTIQTNSEGYITSIVFNTPEGETENRTNYTVSYSTDPSDSSSSTETDSVTNTAILTPREGVEGQPIPAVSTVTLEEAKLNKTGSYEWNGQIKWTVTVNENNKNIAGGVLTDSMLGQLTPSDITIQDGSWQSVPADSGQYTINTDGEGKVVNITFLAIADGVNTNKYILTYYTTPTQEWNDKIVRNEAKLTLNGQDISKPADVTVPGSGDIAKSAGTGKVSADGNTLTIPWTVTLTVPKGGRPVETIVIDDVTRKDEWTTNTNQWITRDQADALKAAGMTWTDNDGKEKGTVTLSDALIHFDGVEGTYTGFKITFEDGLIPPDGATKLTFTYETTADLTKTVTGQNKFYNLVEVGGKKQSAEYIFYKPSIQKTDGNGQTGASTVSSSGSLTWKVKASVGMGHTSLTLIDTLPEGVTLESLQLTGWSNLNVALTVGEDGTISGSDTTDRCTITGAYSDQVITLVISPKAENQTFTNGEEFTLTVNCRVTNASSSGSSALTLTNNVTMKLDDEDIGSASQTQNWTYQEDTQDVVSKTGTWDNNARLLTYTVQINPDGKNLDENSDELVLEDVLKYKHRLGFNINEAPWWTEVDINISLNQGSVKLKNLNPEGADPNWSWQYSTGTEGEYTLNTLSVTVPDGVPLQLEYSYSVSSTAKKGQTFELDISNKATLQTEYYDEDFLESGRTWKNQTTSGGVSSSSALVLTKVNAANNGEYLPGAEFTVYAYRQKTGGDVTKADWVYEWMYTTDSSGAITIAQGDASKNEHVFDTDILYKVVETQAPSGYLLPDSPTEIYFYFSGSDSSSIALPDGVALSSAVDLNKIGNSVIVKNTKIPTTSIEVKKQWQDKDGNPLSNPSQPVTIKLYQKTTSGSSSGGTMVGISATEKGTSVDTSKFNITEVANGSKIRIKLELFYAIDPAWGWMPIVTVSGADGATTTDWILVDNNAYGHSTYTYEGTVNGDVSISYSNNPGDIKSITITVLQEPTISDPGGSSITGDPYRTITLNNGNVGWFYTFKNLPLTGLDESGNAVNYYYYVVEDEVANYQTSYDVNGIQQGTIVVTNKAVNNPSYTLPATGGLGSAPYTMGGLLMIVAAGIPLLYSRAKRRKGERQ